MKNQASPMKPASQSINQTAETIKPTNNTKEQKVSRRQFFYILVQTQIGVGILSLPNELHAVSRQDGWISLLVAGVVLPIVLLILWLIAKRYEDLTFFQINEKLFGKWGGRAFSLLYSCYFVSVGVLIVLLFGRMISLWVLPNTPFWVMAVCIVTVGVYLTNGGLLVLARFYTMVSLLLLLLITLSFYSLQEAHWMYLLPIGESGITKIILGAKEALLSFFGFFVSIVIFSRVEGSVKERFKTMLQAHFFVTFFYLLTLIISYTFFSTKEITFVPEPILYMLKSFELPFIARIDLFFISMWFVSVATSFTTYLYMAGQGLKEVFRLKTAKRANVFISLIIVASASLIGYDMTKMETFTKYVIQSGFIFTFYIPPFILIVALVRRRIQKERDEG
ncbi:GerAB/ArcD/ProY family transporter [Halobacillus locisalis]|uniref:GerAB/ArcD/ProY family transporter n=1 Tax=Halobacillus locisalis TaxID=220753 RepID=A0A838CRL6_9BACI|nr:GerAB/ArcD/ProY family transporter [Halobacillus locisalis]MBA2174660.1 GerAB/ArcD/ProY family transporter [Halobacillus locisalis]